jgi:predicted nucleic-acid-binding protein
MIGLDTNLLIRYLTKDEASQYRKVQRLIEDAVAATSASSSTTRFCVK